MGHASIAKYKVLLAFFLQWMSLELLDGAPLYVWIVCCYTLSGLITGSMTLALHELSHNLGAKGIFGMNLFYRDIKDLVELANTGLPGSEDDPSNRAWIFQPRNTGDGQVWGAEFDLSTPLSGMGLDDTGVFVNYTWLDSEISDEFGKRRFNNQSNYVYNVGFIQELPTLAASFGVTFRKQGDAKSRVIGEEVVTSYDGDLEAFIEKRIGKAWAVRLTGINLLDQSKDEVFDKFSTVQDQINRDYDEYELETETGGRAVQLIVRLQY